MTAIPVRAVLLGCGMVAEEYATTLASAPGIEVVACADLDSERAAAFADRHHLTALPAAQLLDPAFTDLAVILTPPHTHATVVSDAIAARIPAIWCEKPLALDPADADRVVHEAATAGTLLAVAPDTVLGPALRTAAHALAEGIVGSPLSATATLLSTGPERWHPAPEPFYAHGAGPLGDMGPYYLAALDLLFGRLRVHSAIARTRPVRTIRSGPATGKHFTAQAPTHLVALLEAETSGIPITLTASLDAAATRAPHIEIQGTAGTLLLPDPNFHDGEVQFTPYGERAWRTLPQAAADTPPSRGAGVINLAHALRNAKPPLCPADRAARTAHLAHAILEAATPRTLPRQPQQPLRKAQEPSQ
ncbi:Gfo/Idh/MocA family oxidoreductase [Streptomyces sp. NPDC093801]|uniref:Gfo/Idh/MocA family protein n=1 Tax=Streptomyces sp. NPDC093801 TaxID=3155203 RepID=UPI00344D38FD